MPNKLCIIEGDFDLSHLKSAQKCDSSISSLNDLIDWYKSKSSERVAESSTGENSNDYVVINSKDGSELCANLLQDMSTTFDIDATLINNNTIINASSNPNESKLVSRVSSSSFICFLIDDFKQEDGVFLKLEETQSKISSILNAINNTTLSTSNTTIINNNSSLAKRILIFGWPILNHCYENNLSLLNASDIDRPLYCKSMSGCFVCFTGFKKENKHTVAQCIKLVHYMGGSVRKEYNKKITHLIVKSTLSTKYKTAYNIGRCHLLTEDWILDSWNHRNQVDFNVNDEDFLKKFRLKALYSLVIAFYGFTKEETQHMKEVTIENGGTPISDYDDPQCTHIVINDQEIKYRPCLDLDKDGENSIDSSSSGTNSSPAKQIDVAFHKNLPPFSNTRALIVKAEWFWASIQICCRASECLYEFTKPKEENIGGLNTISATKLNGQDPPNKRIKLSSDNLLSSEIMNSNVSSNKSPHPSHLSSTSKTPTQLYAVQSSESAKLAANSSSSGLTANQSKISSNNLLSHNAGLMSNVVCENDYESPTVVNSNHNINTRRSRNKNNLSCNNLSTSASLLDATTDDAMSVDSPFEKQRESAGHGILNSASSNGANNTKKINKRSQRIIELYETEKRFVNILHTIIHLFKEPIESPDQVAGPILDQTEVKEIFGNLPPIYEVHCKIKDRLEKLANRIFLSDESSSVGEIYLDNADSLLKTYPPFVNFYEKTKDAILTADKLKPRFHAFLKIAQSKPECGRQTLVELFIRPVQRLPSTLLLLDDILKETPKGHRDLDLLTKAIASLKEVMTHINEDKRKIENQLAMFVLINDIENCPATLLSSHRIFLKKLDVYEMSSELHKKGAQLTLFLFTDCLEICKPRLKLLNAAKSPNAGAKQRTPQKCYKHIALFSLNNITKVCDILQNNDDTDLFGILCRLAGEKDKFFSFKVIASNTSSQQNQSSSLGTSSFNSVSTANLANNSCTNTSTISSSSSTVSANTYSNIYSSTTNLNTNDEHYQAQLEKKEYIKLLAQGICNVKCITEYTCTTSTPLNEPSRVKKLATRKSTSLDTLVKPIFASDESNLNANLLFSNWLLSPISSSSSSSMSSFLESSSSSFEQETKCLFDEHNNNILQIEKRLNQEIDYCNQLDLEHIMFDRSKREKRDLYYQCLVKQFESVKVKKPILFKKHSIRRFKRKFVRKDSRSLIRDRKCSSYYSRRYSYLHSRRKMQYLNQIKKHHENFINELKQKENILCTIEAKQLQIDLNESGGSKKLDAVKSYARIINRRVSRAFSFSQDTPNKIKKTISSVFRSPFQSSYSQQSLNDQKASKLTSLASLQLTPTLLEKRKFITLQKSTLPLISPPPNKQNQPKRGSHTIHLLSTRTLKNLRSSTTTSTINGVSSSSSRSSNTQSTSSFSLTASLASIHKSSSMFKRSKNKSAKKSELQENGSYLNGEDEPTPSTEDLQYYNENNYTDMFDTNEDDYEEETNETESNSDDFDDDLEDLENMTPKNLEKDLDIGQASSNLITNLFSASKKKSSKFLSANSIKNLKKKSSLKSTKSSTASTGEEKNSESVLVESKNTSLISGINQLENLSN